MMFIIAIILYLTTVILTISALFPDFWVNTNVPSAGGIILIFYTLSLIMLLRKRAKFFKLFNFYIAVFTILFISVEGIIIYYAAAPQKQEECEYIIVLGSGMYEQNKLTIELEGRLDKAIELSGEHPKLKIILSGGVDKNRGLPQSTAMEEYLTEQYKKKNKKPPAVIIEDKSTTTYDSLRLCDEKVKQLYGNHIKSAYVITNDYHNARVKILSSRVGFKACTINARLPYAKYPLYYVKEAVELSKSALTDGFIKP